MSKLVFNDAEYLFNGDVIGDIYHQLAVDLFESTVRRLKARGIADLEKNPYIWQIEKLSQLRLLNEHNFKIIVERSGIAEKKLREVVENEGYQIYKDTKQQLLQDMNKSYPLQNEDMQRRLIALSNQAMYEINNVINTTLPESVIGTYKGIVTQAVSEVVAGTSSADKALNKIIMQWHEKGFYGFTDKGGKRWKADVYARTVVKSTLWRTYNEARVAPARELGIDTFYYSMKSAARELCAPLQHQIVTTGPARTENGVKVYSLADYGYGTPGGCRGINCQHMMTPFIIGVNEKPDLPEYLRNVSPKQAKENAEAQSQQRLFERNIRKNKERMYVAKLLGDQDLITKFALVDKKLASGLTKLINDYPFLRAEMKRERVYRNRESLRSIEKELVRDFEMRYNRFNENLNQKLTKEQFKDLTSHNLSRIKKVMIENDEIGNRLSLKISKQFEHLLGTEDYLNRNDGQSYFIKPNEKVVYDHMLRNMDMKKIFNRYQFIPIGSINGVHIVDTMEKIKADQIKVHQSSKGIHGVPNKEKKGNRGG